MTGDRRGAAVQLAGAAPPPGSERRSPHASEEFAAVEKCPTLNSSSASLRKVFDITVSGYSMLTNFLHSAVWEETTRVLSHTRPAWRSRAARAHDAELARFKGTLSVALI